LLSSYDIHPILCYDYVCIEDFTKLGRQPQRERHIKQLKACLIQLYVCDYFNHKLTFLPNKHLTEIKIYLSLGWSFKANFNSHVFMLS